jgi:hypothetical protein
VRARFLFNEKVEGSGSATLKSAEYSSTEKKQKEEKDGFLPFIGMTRKKSAEGE